MRGESDHFVAVITVDSLILDIPINLSLHVHIILYKISTNETQIALKKIGNNHWPNNLSIDVVGYFCAIKQDIKHQFV
jgi:hypothetical protein